MENPASQTVMLKQNKLKTMFVFEALLLNRTKSPIKEISTPVMIGGMAYRFKA